MQTKSSLYNGNDKETEQEKAKEKEQEQEQEQEQEKEQLMEQERIKEKELERIREKERIMEKEREQEREMERGQEKERMRKKEREMEKEREREMAKEKEKEKEREQEREKEKERVKEREKEKERVKEMELEREIEKEKARVKEMELEREIARVKEMELERNKEKERVKEMELEREIEKARVKEKASVLQVAENTRVSDNVFANVKKYSHAEYQYINLIHNILDNGHWEEGRNGKTQSIFGTSMRFTLKNGQIPIFTTKKTAWKTCLKELLWFIRGDTDVKNLQKQDVHIWDGNSSREFLNSRGLNNYPEGIIGPCYGYQWRFFNSNYNCYTGNRITDYQPLGGIDQLQQIIDQLKNPATRNSRRLVMTAWNPKQLDQMALPPCHILCQFNVHDGNKLSCSMYQRSGDVGLGICFNIASYSFLTHLLAKHCGLEADEFVYFLGNAHIYDDHIQPLKEQVKREPFEFPTVSINTVRENINDYEVDDFVLYNYQSHDAIKMNMRK
jgi:thymidylate synthase